MRRIIVLLNICKKAIGAVVVSQLWCRSCGVVVVVSFATLLIQ